jgi:hypothetical protein
VYLMRRDIQTMSRPELSPLEVVHDVSRMQRVLEAAKLLNSTIDIVWIRTPLRPGVSDASGAIRVMCDIAGVLHIDGLKATHVLGSRMTSVIARRGSDGQGTRHTPRVEARIDSQRTADRNNV